MLASENWRSKKISEHWGDETCCWRLVPLIADSRPQNRFLIAEFSLLARRNCLECVFYQQDEMLPREAEQKSFIEFYSHQKVCLRLFVIAAGGNFFFFRYSRFVCKNILIMRLVIYRTSWVRFSLLISCKRAGKFKKVLTSQRFSLLS